MATPVAALYAWLLALLISGTLLALLVVAWPRTPTRGFLRAFELTRDVRAAYSTIFCGLLFATLGVVHRRLSKASKVGASIGGAILGQVLGFVAVLSSSAGRDGIAATIKGLNAFGIVDFVSLVGLVAFGLYAWVGGSLAFLSYRYGLRLIIRRSAASPHGAP
jgi:hypothetical protein